jgi:DNA invertase Pin-like site-specific DNA recombinase
LTQSKPRSFAYSRVSTQEQSRHGLSLREQDATNDRLVERLQAELADRYCDAGVSAFKKRPPEFERMLRDIAAADGGGQPIQYVVASAIDRLGRNMRTGIEAACMLMDDIGVHIVTPAVDTSQPGGRQALYFSLFMAEQESENNSRRVKDTREPALRRKGYAFGGRRKYGREPIRDDSGRVTGWRIVESEAEVIRRIVAMFLSGTAVRAIARQLNGEDIPAAEGGRWRATGITKMLRRPDLAGLYFVDGELLPSTLESIVPEEDWRRVQARFAAQASGPRAPQGRPAALPYLLDQPILLLCGVCGSRMRPATRRRGGRPALARYVCVEHEIHSTCSMPYVPRDLIDRLVIDLFRTELLDEGGTLRTMKCATKQADRDIRVAVAEAEREVMRAEGRLARIRGDYKDGTLFVEEWRELRDEIAVERRAAEAEVAQLSERLASFAREDALLNAQRGLYELLGRLRDLAVRYDPNHLDDGLIAAIRHAMSDVVEQVVIHSSGVPAELVTHRSPGGGVLVSSTQSPAVSVEVFPRTTTTPPTYFERVTLPAVNKDPFASMIWSVPSAFAA